MHLRVEKVNRSKRKKEIKEIYTSSFSKEDRMPFSMMIVMSYLWNTDFLSFYDHDTLCGFIYTARIRKFMFVMFFAVDEKHRSKGYGSSILDKLQSINEKTKIVTSIEPCDKDCEDFEQRLRRKKFYSRNGYGETGYSVILGGKKQELLVKNGDFKKWEFIFFFLLYSNFTMIPKIYKSTK